MKLKAFCRFTFLILIVAGCHNESVTPRPPMLDYYTETFDLTPTLGSPPQTEVRYEYNHAGLLEKITLLTFNPTSGKMEEQRNSLLTYKGTLVDSLKEYWSASGTPFAKYAYEYLPDSRVSRISETNYSAALTSVANFTYSDANDSVRAVYTYSNGAGFEYAFSYGNGNIQRDKTTQGASYECNTGTYTYDQHVNPFSTLGYLDYGLYNLSINNKLTERVNYTGCFFPTLMPESHTYEYNDRGYPVTATTKYTGSTYTSQRKFFYR